MKKTRQGNILLPIPFKAFIPDSWSLTYDGEKYCYEETFTEITDEIWEATNTTCQYLGAQPKRVGNKLILEINEERAALFTLIGELMAQSEALGYVAQGTCIKLVDLIRHSITHPEITIPSELLAGSRGF